MPLSKLETCFLAGFELWVHFRIYGFSLSLKVLVARPWTLLGHILCVDFVFVSTHSLVKSYFDDWLY